MITEFGGAVAVPNAVRSSDSTTTMRVNDVMMIRIDGAIDTTVSSAISWIARSVTPPLPWPRLMLMSGANAEPASDVAAIRVTRNKTLRGNGADLTKASLGGPAMTPSRLRDSQNRSSKALRPEGPSGAHCGARGPAAVRVRPEVQRDRRSAGAMPLRAAAPSRRDFGPRSAAEVAAAGQRRARARESAAALAVRSGGAGGGRRARFARGAAGGSGRGAIMGGGPGVSPAAPPPPPPGPAAPP